MNPFEHVKNLHTKKRRWEDFNDEEKKSRKKRIQKDKAIYKQKFLNKRDE